MLSGPSIGALSRKRQRRPLKGLPTLFLEGAPDGSK
jgi:hypothetical protein